MKHLIKIESVAHGVLGARHAGLDQQYCEAGEIVILEWQPDAGWGLQEAHYTDGDGNVTAIEGGEFTMPNKDIVIGGTFKNFVLDDWTGDVSAENVKAEGDVTAQGDVTAKGNVIVEGDVVANGVTVEDKILANIVEVEESLILKDVATGEFCNVIVEDGVVKVKQA